MKKAFFWGVTLLFADFISKEIALRYMETVKNTGIAFGIPVPNLAMAVFSPILLFFFLWFAKKYFLKNNTASLAIALILAGGLGNFLDRIARGGVVDFIDLGFWPAFNLADSFLTTGAFLLVFFYGKILKDEKRSS